MLTELQKELLKNKGFDFENINDIIFYLYPIAEFLYSHNKNYNKGQYLKIDIINDIISSLYNGI